MSRVAIATSRFAQPGARGGLEVHEDVDSPMVINALRVLGVEARLETWDDEDVDWESYDLVVVRSTWGYARVRDQFLAWARARPHLVNPYDVIEYCTDKHYLGDLFDQGLPVIASTYCEVGDEPVFPDGDVVVKPTVGAGSVDAARFTSTQLDAAREHVARLHAGGRCALIQPYVHSIDDNGERALVFIDGEFSHAMTKRAMLNVAPEDRDGDFRNRQMSPARGEAGAIEVAHQFLSGRLAGLTYGRVDLVATPEGWRLMELELVEPALYLGYDDRATARLTRAIVARL
ncbi:MAG TPA: hypothetical protein VIJ86_01070 [Acidimicrobiales bacterium]